MDKRIYDAAISDRLLEELERYIRSRFREEEAEMESDWSAGGMAEASDACEGAVFGDNLPDAASASDVAPASDGVPFSGTLLASNAGPASDTALALDSVLASNAGPASGYYEDAAECSDEIKEQKAPRYALGSAKKKHLMESVSYPSSPERSRGSRRGYGSVAEALPGLTSRRDKAGASQPSLSDVMTHVGENFREMLLRLIDEKGLSDPYVYKRANLDRKLFSKIRCNPDYCPSRKTVIALAIALELTLDETADLLSRAGYAFSPGSKADLIVEFCILNKIYDIFEVDMLLFKYGQPTLS